MQIGAVILAAGAATRMGEIKQLLLFRGKTLVENAICQAEIAGFAPVVAVLGAHAAAVQSVVRQTRANCVINEDWQSGMGSSISAGLGRLLELAPEVDALAILLADQPLITSDHLEKMSLAFAAGSAPIVAAEYSGTLGVPAIFAKSMLQTLRCLPPQAGARAIISENSNVLKYQLPEAASDIDTPADFASLPA